MSYPRGEAMTPVQFGVAGLGTVEGRVYVDKVRNNTYDPKRDTPMPFTTIDIVWAGIDGVLGTEDDVTIAQTTDANGWYSLANVPVGAYMVRAASATPGAEMKADKETTLRNNSTSQVDFVMSADTEVTAPGIPLPQSGAPLENQIRLALMMILFGLVLARDRRRRSELV